MVVFDLVSQEECCRAVTGHWTRMSQESFLEAEYGVHRHRLLLIELTVRFRGFLSMFEIWLNILWGVPSPRPCTDVRASFAVVQDHTRIC